MSRSSNSDYSDELPWSFQRAQLFDNFKVNLDIIHLKKTDNYKEDIKKNPWNKKKQPDNYNMYNTILKRGASVCLQVFQLNEDILDDFIRDDKKHMNDTHTIVVKLNEYNELAKEMTTSKKQGLQKLQAKQMIDLRIEKLKRDQHALEFMKHHILNHDFTNRNPKMKDLVGKAREVDLHMNTKGDFYGLNEEQFPDGSLSTLSLPASSDNQVDPVQNAKNLLKALSDMIMRPPSSPDAPKGP